MDAITRWLRQHPMPYYWRGPQPRVGTWDDGLVVKEMDPETLDWYTDQLLASWH
jgi:hypothetical protein